MITLTSFRMHGLLPFFCCFLATTLLSAQADKIEMLNIGLVMPTVNEVPKLSEPQLSKLETKVLNLLTNNGLSSQGGGDGIVLYPKIDLFDDADVNTGMQNLKVVRLSLSLFIKQADDNVVFSSASRELSGSGRSREQALNNALNNVNPDDAKWTNFITQAKTKIGLYYQKMCPNLLTQADQLGQTGQTERAISLLLNVPKEVPCFNDVKNKSIELYKKYIARECAQYMKLAKAKLALNDYKGALAFIARIDPESPCFNDALNTINTVSREMDEETRREWDFLKERYKNSVELEKSRINAIRDIGVAYGQSQQRTYNYLLLVR
jgi:hypothetical protein